MSLLGNILWLIFGGFVSGLLYIVGGLLVCLTVIGIPFGLQSIKIGVATFTPFGRQLREVPDANSPGRLLFNVVWLLAVGWGIAVAHVTSAFFLALTIIGIPFAWQHLKLVPLALLPFGRELV